MLYSRRNRHSTDAWPGFVDALASVLLVFVFLLMIFVLAQYFLTDVLLGRDRALDLLKQEVAQLADALSMTEETAARQQEEIFSLQGRLDAGLKENQRLASERDKAQAALVLKDEQITLGKEQLEIKLRELASLQQDIAALRDLRVQLEGRIGALTAASEQQDQQLGSLRDRSKTLETRLADAEERTLLAQREIAHKDIRILELATRVEETAEALREEQTLSEGKRNEVSELTRRMAALQAQLASLSNALELSQQEVDLQKVEIGQLTKRLNIELVRKVQELSRYRSEFFGRLREVLGDHPDIRIEGDRFTFQSELLFESAAADIGKDGKGQLKKLAVTLNEVSRKIPAEIDWVLRIDGHTDKRPISNERYPSNWELSTARALSIVKYLIEQGVPATRLAATGFAEHHPLDRADTQAAYEKNRRIEIKLTGR